MKLIETEWNNYRNAVIPKDAPPVQVVESRRAFFAGAWALYALQMNHLDEDREPTEADLKFMASLDAEMRQFGERVKKGWA
jgi:hypothetical protein